MTGPVAAIDSYITDMLALEEHIQKAVSGQAASENSAPYREQLEQARLVCEEHIAILTRLSQRRQQGGQGVSKTVKKVVSSVLGTGAAIVDLVRTEQLPKELRDDYTAVSLACIGYVMLQTTALALGDLEVANVAEAHLADHARLVMTFNEIIPRAVVDYLRDSGHDVNDGVLPEVGRAVRRAWQDTEGAASEDSMHDARLN